MKWKVDILDLLLSRIPVFDVYNNTIAYELLYEDHDPRQVKEFILKYRSDLLNKKAAFTNNTEFIKREIPSRIFASKLISGSRFSDPFKQRSIK